MQDQEYTEIPLRRRDGSIRAIALVDNEDAYLGDLRWSFSTGYAVRSMWTPGVGQWTQMLHRAIFGLTPGDHKQVDHKDRDRLNCRRSNLRVGTHALNSQNLGLRGGKSRYRGVTWASGKWRAYATINGRQHNLGRFADEHEAGAVAASFRSKYMLFYIDNGGI